MSALLRTASDSTGMMSAADHGSSAETINQDNTMTDNRCPATFSQVLPPAFTEDHSRSEGHFEVSHEGEHMYDEARDVRPLATEVKIRNTIFLFETLRRLKIEQATADLIKFSLDDVDDASGTFRLFLCRLEAEAEKCRAESPHVNLVVFQDAFNHNLKALESSLAAVYEVVSSQRRANEFDASATTLSATGPADDETERAIEYHEVPLRMQQAQAAIIMLNQTMTDFVQYRDFISPTNNSSSLRRQMDDKKDAHSLLEVHLRASHGIQELEVNVLARLAISVAPLRPTCPLCGSHAELRESSPSHRSEPILPQEPSVVNEVDTDLDQSPEVPVSRASSFRLSGPQEPGSDGTKANKGLEPQLGSFPLQYETEDETEDTLGSKLTEPARVDVTSHLKEPPRPRSSLGNDLEEYSRQCGYYDDFNLHQKTYPTNNLGDLANTLDSSAPPTQTRNSSFREHPEEISHAILHTLSTSGHHHWQSFADAESCIDGLYSERSSQTSQVLFLRGYSSPEWLLSIAGTCSINPEFLTSNVVFKGRKSDFSSPTLPSSNEDIIRLRVPTIGVIDHPSGSQPIAASVQEMRLRSEEHMSQYLDDLKTGHNVNICDSVVRDLHVIDERFSVVEQEISVCLHTSSKGWLAWVCQDSGKSLAEDSERLWLRKSKRNSVETRDIRFVPIHQHGNNDWIHPGKVKNGEQTQTHNRYPQAAALLPLAFGNSLNREIMARDPLYALAEIFRLCASSESQFLTLLEMTIVRDTDHKSLQAKNPTLIHLAYCREILSTHSEWLRDLIQSIERHRRRHPLQHSIKDKHLQRKAEHFTNNLLTDFEHLVRRADLLWGRCNTGMVVIGNNAMLDESRLAIIQARRIARLTFISCIFVPLSFASSFIGMIPGDASMSIWAAMFPAVLLVAGVIFFTAGGTFEGASARVHSLIASTHGGTVDDVSARLNSPLTGKNLEKRKLYDGSKSKPSGTRSTRYE